MEEIFHQWAWFWPVPVIFIYWAIELCSPREQIDYSVEFRREILPISVKMLGTLASIPLLGFILEPTLVSMREALTFTGLYALPVWGRALIGVLLVELIYYGIHWQMHHNSTTLWNAHKFHHSFEKMWVMPGYRISVLSLFIYHAMNSIMVVFDAPVAIAIFYVLYTPTHHLNVKTGDWMKYLEWFIVTPRYHYIHHSTNMELQGSNLGRLFTFYDRIFGTYVDPSTLDYEKEELGLGEDDPVVFRTVAGV